MQAAILPFRYGWQWILDGIAIFRKQPMAMFFWSLVTSLIITLTYLIPVLGQALLIASMPILTFITLCACRNISEGKTMMPGMWLAPLQDTDVRRQLIRLGFAYLGVCLLGGFISVLPFLGNLMAALETTDTVNEAALVAAIRGPFITFALIYILISALFWHAPALMGWHRLKLSQALFYSMVACWRNKWPFLLYGASWAAIFFAVQQIGSLLIASGVGAGVVQFVLTPVNLAVAALLYCSFYPTYMSVFGNNHPSPRPV